jgi:bifunctional non-homologous end joining protein LigD
MDPKIKRLAIMVEDHPYDYKDFAGTIPSGYGAGTVKIWDHGTYDVDGGEAKESEQSVLKGIKKGAFHFSLKGKKLKGTFTLVRLERLGKKPVAPHQKSERLNEKVQQVVGQLKTFS